MTHSSAAQLPSKGKESGRVFTGYRNNPCDPISSISMSPFPQKSHRLSSDCMADEKTGSQRKSRDVLLYKAFF